MPPDIVIRVGRADEIDTVLALWEAAESPESVGADREGVSTLLERDPDALLVAELDGEVVGTVVAGWDGWRASIYRLAVLPEHRRIGIAQRLVEAAEERLRALGVRKIGAIVLNDNDRAVGFWCATGYERQDDVGRYVRALRS